VGLICALGGVMFYQLSKDEEALRIGREVRRKRWGYMEETIRGIPSWEEQQRRSEEEAMERERRERESKKKREEREQRSGWRRLLP